MPWVLLDVSRDLSGGSSEVDFFLPRFIRLLSLRPAEHFFLTVTTREKAVSVGHSLPACKPSPLILPSPHTLVYTHMHGWTCT